MDGTTTQNQGAAGEPWSADAPAAQQPQVLVTSGGDTCANCGSRLAGDQRYCVECGERRGKPRYSLPVTATAGAGTAAKQPPRAPRASRWAGNGTLALIAGVGVLLMAMGVGVLIGRDSNGSSSAGKTPTIVIPGANSAAPATATGGAATTPAASPTSGSKSTSASKSKSTSKAKVKLSSSTKAKLKVIPPKLKSAVVKQGQKCASGGKFTGAYFGASGTNSSGCTK